MRLEAALAVRKATGTKLGNPINLGQAGRIGRDALASSADEHAQSLLPVLQVVRAAGATTLAAIATELNDRKVPTPRGARWHVSSVMNLIARAQKLEAVR